jgi:putative ABC transport system permease protein
MRTVDIVRAAVRNSFRSKLRTTLTVIAIFIGAFTLTITNGLGTGINNYIDTQLGSIGADDVMAVSKPVETTPASEGPAKYDPDAAEELEGNGPPGLTVLAMTDDDLDTIREIENVESIEATVQVQTDFIQHDGGTKYELAVSPTSAGIAVELVAGDEFDAAASELELVLTTDFVEPLGYDSNEDAVGTTVTIGTTDAAGEQHTVEATVAGVQEATLFSNSVVLDDALTTELYDLQSIGLPDDSADQFASAILRFDPSIGDAGIATLKADLLDAGYEAITVADQLGSFKAIIDGIILVLNAFAFIALLAAGFGIINTLLMSVQERTREIGLMKAMGMSRGRIFSLFSLEAVFIGFLGSAIGAAVAIGVGLAISGVLAGGALADLAGLQIIAFTPASIVTVLLLVMGIAFIAAVLPASRAARQSPIDSLRYE